MDRYLESRQDKRWQTHEAKFRIDAAAQHGPSTVRPLDVVKAPRHALSAPRKPREWKQEEEYVGDNDDSASEYSDDDNDHTFPHDGTPSEDDDCDGYPEDPKYIDSGWCGQCLRDIEDIDFDFVYALHTFVATVEGQANATKGDTMVLLDDSNSYWWLVRVVKDNSIGKFRPFFRISGDAWR